MNWILTANHGKKIAVIENEFGEVGVDDALLKNVINTDEVVFEMNNGCICCTVRQDLIEVVKKLIASKTKLDAIIIETTGLADPAPVCQTFFVDPDVEKYARLDAVVTVVDAKHIAQHLDEVKPEGVENEAVEQVAFADRILLNKCDLVSEEELVALESRLKSMNHVAHIIRTQLNASSLPLDKIMGLNAFSLDRVLAVDSEFLEESHGHHHESSVGSVGFSFQGDMNLTLLEDWIMDLLQLKGNDLYRYKGILAIKGMSKKYVFQGVHMTFDGMYTTEWKPSEVRINRFVFIGKNLDRDELKKDFMECLVTEEPRFPIGSKVVCLVQENWIDGTVQSHWEEGNPYRVILENGTEHWIFDDDDCYIRQAFPIKRKPSPCQDQGESRPAKQFFVTD